MKKISLITLHASKNYGSVLQAYASQEIFKNFGLDVEVVDFIREDTMDKNLYMSYAKKSLPLFITKIVLFPTIFKWKKVFRGFVVANLNLTSITYTNSEDFHKYPVIADIYCVGSDQVWNSGWNKGIIESLFLSYAQVGKLMFSYASSFGKNELEEWEKVKIKQLFERFNAISVREKSAVNIVSELGYKAINVLDPTMMMDRQYWRGFAGKRKIKEPYILIYKLNNDKFFDRHIKSLAKNCGKALYRLCTRYDQMIKTGKSILIPEVRDFVNYIAYSDCVITDSFHATAFSINMNIDFICKLPKKYSNRISDMLETTGLLNRIANDYQEYLSLYNEKINYIGINDIIASERSKAIEFLNEQLMKANNNE